MKDKTNFEFLQFMIFWPEHFCFHREKEIIDLFGHIGVEFDFPDDEFSAHFIVAIHRLCGQVSDRLINSMLKDQRENIPFASAKSRLLQPLIIADMQMDLEVMCDQEECKDKDWFVFLHKFIKLIISHIEKVPV